MSADLLLNAGVFTPLFDQAREPGLLADPVLFSRVPVAYGALAVGVTATAWTLDAAGATTIRRAVLQGATVGLVFAVTGIVWLWTAIDMTAAFVTAGAASLVTQMGAAGAVLGAARTGVSRRRIRRGVALGLICAVLLAVAAQNLLT